MCIHKPVTEKTLNGKAGSQSLEKALIAGLGNPGPAYIGTRHNIGFAAIDHLGRSVGASWANNRRKAMVARVSIDGYAVSLVKPQTFMNLSGQAVSPIVKRLGILPDAVVVLHDDIDLELGKVRVKSGGGDGGHKGVRSIAEALGSSLFTRIRLGIGRPPAGKSPEEYVLERFRPDEKPLATFLIQLGIEAAHLLLSHDPEYVKTVIHPMKFSERHVAGAS